MVHEYGNPSVPWYIHKKTDWRRLETLMCDSQYMAALKMAKSQSSAKKKHNLIYDVIDHNLDTFGLVGLSSLVYLYPGK